MATTDECKNLLLEQKSLLESQKLVLDELLVELKKLNKIIGGN